MKIKFKLFYITLFFSYFFPIFLFTNFAFLSCAQKNDLLQIANFESYMASELIEDIEKKYGAKFVYYPNNETIEAKFEKYYDIAIPSSYEIINLWSQDLIQEIDWKKFNIENIGGDKIEKAKQAISLFNYDEIDYLNKQAKIITTKMIETKKTNKTTPITNILDWCVPYFFQNFMFAYKGSEIEFYDPNGTKVINKNNLTWNDIFYTVGPLNPNCDRRFKPTKKMHLGMVDDARTIYEIAKTLKDNKKTHDDISLDEATNIFLSLTDYFTIKTWISLHSDSGIISHNLSVDNGGYIGAFAWSGDIFYAATQHAEAKNSSFYADNFHIVKPNHSLISFDGLVINKKSIGQKKNKIYQIIKQIALDGCNVNKHKLFSKKNNEFLYWTVRNFHKLGYTPPLKNLYESLIDTNNPCEYWNEFINLTKINGEINKKTLQMYIDIIKINQNKYHKIYEEPLNNISNSNISWAWLQVKNNL